MSVFEIVCGIALLLIGFFLTLVVILQEGKDNGLSGAIQGGSSESFLNTGGNRTKDAKLKRTLYGLTNEDEFVSEYLTNQNFLIYFPLVYLKK